MNEGILDLIRDDLIETCEFHKRGLRTDWDLKDGILGVTLLICDLHDWEKNLNP